MTWTEAVNGPRRSRFWGCRSSVCVCLVRYLYLYWHTNYIHGGHKNHLRKPCYGSVMSEYWGMPLTRWYGCRRFWDHTFFCGITFQKIISWEPCYLQFILHKIFKTGNLYPLTLAYIFAKWFFHSLAQLSERNQCRGCVCMCVCVLKNKG